MGIEILVALGLSAAIGTVASLGQQLAAILRREQSQPETTDQRIRKLTQALSESATVINDIESEIRERHRVVEQLQEDVLTYERLRDVNQAEVEAVAQVLGGELKKESRRSFWVNFATNLSFFILGAIVSVITTLLIS